MDGDRYRIFFSARDAENRSTVGWADFLLGNRPKIPELLQEGADAFLVSAPPGHFDDSGIGLGSIVHDMARTDSITWVGIWGSVHHGATALVWRKAIPPMRRNLPACSPARSWTARPKIPTPCHLPLGASIGIG